METLGVHVLRAVAARASPLRDLVREVLRTSFTTVEASGNSVRQRDLLPLPVPWSWAPFAEFLWQAVDERRHRSSHRERRRRRELHGVVCWSLLAICVLNFLYAGVSYLQELRVCREKPRPAQLAAIRRIVRDARWLVGRAPEDGAAQTTSQNFTQVLKHKRVGYTGEEVSRPEPLKLFLGSRPRAPSGSSTRSHSRLVRSEKHSSTQVSSFSQKLNVLEFGQRGCMRLMRSGTRSGRSCFSAA